MNKRINFIVFLLGSFNIISAQKNINLILSVDEQIPTGAITNVKLMPVYNNGDTEIITTSYFPGNIALDINDYKKLADSNTKTIFIIFDYNEVYGEKNIRYSYKIDIKKGWLTHYYYILYVYNTTKKKYKNLFAIHNKEKYAFEFEYPGGGVRLIRNEIRKHGKFLQ